VRESGEAEEPIELRQRESQMNAYTTDTPRGAFAVFAVGLAALTLGTLVVGPAVFDAMSATDTPYAAASPAPIEVSITPARIEVQGVREPNVAWAMPQSEPCRPQG
jgi:hypothetical protein